MSPYVALAALEAAPAVLGAGPLRQEPKLSAAIDWGTSVAGRWGQRFRVIVNGQAPCESVGFTARPAGRAHVQSAGGALRRDEESEQQRGSRGPSVRPGQMTRFALLTHTPGDT